MVYASELLLWLTIGLFVGTVLIAVAVAVLACFLCKLRKRIEAELNGNDRVKRVRSDSNRPMNKYMPSVRRTSVGDPECYESPPSTEIKQNKGIPTFGDDDRQKLPLANQAESIEKKTRNNSNDSYIEMLNDGQTQGDEEFYLEPMDNVKVASSAHERIILQPETKPKPTTKKQTKTKAYSNLTEKNPQYPRSFNQKNNSMTSKQSSTHDIGQGCHTADQLVEDDYYIAMQSTANEGYEQEEFYGNQEMFVDLNEKGNPTGEDEIYGNEEAIARHKTDGYHVTGDDHYYVHNQNSHVSEESQYLQIHADYCESDEIYENQHPSSSS